MIALPKETQAFLLSNSFKRQIISGEGNDGLFDRLSGLAIEAALDGTDFSKPGAIFGAPMQLNRDLNTVIIMGSAGSDEKIEEAVIEKGCPSYCMAVTRVSNHFAAALNQSSPEEIIKATPETFAEPYSIALFRELGFEHMAVLGERLQATKAEAQPS